MTAPSSPGEGWEWGWEWDGDGTGIEMGTEIGMGMRWGQGWKLDGDGNRDHMGMGTGMDTRGHRAHRFVGTKCRGWAAKCGHLRCFVACVPTPPSLRDRCGVAPPRQPVSSARSELILSNIHVSANGEWECAVSTSQGNVSKKVEIVVLETSASYCPAERVTNNRGDFRWGPRWRRCRGRGGHTWPVPHGQRAVRAGASPRRR